MIFNLYLNGTNPITIFTVITFVNLNLFEQNDSINVFIIIQYLQQFSIIIIQFECKLNLGNTSITKIIRIIKIKNNNYFKLKLLILFNYKNKIIRMKI